MDRLWAPWRAVFFTKKMKGCFFCQYLKQKKDAKNFIVERSRHSFSILNLYPYNNGHLMVVPNRHVDDLAKLEAEEIADLMALVIKTKKLIEKTIHPHGFNVGINFGRVGGAGVADHIHVHLVPRWNGDNNFMSVMGNTKVISQSLQELYRRLKQKLKK